MTTFGWNILASNSANDNISHYQSQGTGSSRYVISWTANQFTSSILIIVWNVQMQSKSGATLQVSFTLNSGLTTFCETTSLLSDTIEGNYSSSQAYSPASCPQITGATATTTTTTTVTIPSPYVTTTSSSSSTTIISFTTTTTSSSASTSSTPSYGTTTSSTTSATSFSSSSLPTTTSASSTSSESSSSTATTTTQSSSTSTSTSSSQQTSTSTSSSTITSSTSQSSSASTSNTTSTIDSNSTIAPSINPSSYGDFTFAFINSTLGGSFCTDTSIAVQYSNSTAENPGWFVELDVTLPSGSTQNTTVAYNIGNLDTPVELSIAPPLPGTYLVSVATYYNGTANFTSSTTFIVVDNC